MEYTAILETQFIFTFSISNRNKWSFHFLLLYTPLLLANISCFNGSMFCSIKWSNFYCETDRYTGFYRKLRCCLNREIINF